VPRQPIYLDSHATTPVDRRALDRMLPFFTEHFGNPASASHQWGWRAQEAVEQARREVATLIRASGREITFTSGATESNNLAIQGVCAVAEPVRRRLVVSAIEHKSVLEGAQSMVDKGFEVTVVPVGRDGRIDVEALRGVVDGRTALVSVMAANNEIGVIQPLADIGAIARAAGAVFHVDAAQAVGKIPIDVAAMQIDLLSLTGHKMYGPKGEGALFVRKRTKIAPLIIGGGQERGLRSGTLNVPGIVGLGAACAICREQMTEDADRLRRLRDRLLEGLRAGLDGVTVNGSLEHRLPQNLHVSFDGVDGEALLVSISDIAVSSGSACASASGEPSHVLQAIMGGDPVPSAAIRFGLGRFTTDEDVEYAIDRFTSVVRHLRSTAPAR
jgi:cysteine desulfurase